jgi:hypothetical protein
VSRTIPSLSVHPVRIAKGALGAETGRLQGAVPQPCPGRSRCPGAHVAVNVRPLSRSQTIIQSQSAYIMLTSAWTSKCVHPKKIRVPQNITEEALHTGLRTNGLFVPLIPAVSDTLLPPAALR